VRYQIIAEAYRDLEAASARLELMDRLASLVRQTPTELLPTVALLCQGQIAPDFAGVELGLNERLAARAVATANGVPPEQVLALARETGDLGLAAERLLQDAPGARPATLEVGVVFDTLHQVAAAEGTGSQGRKLAGLGSLLQQATPLEARYLVRTCTGSLRLGIGTATILDALAEVHAGGRKVRPMLERAYNICSDLVWWPPRWPPAGWPRWRRCRSGPATRCGRCWPSGSASRARSWPSWAGRARPSTSTTASGCRPTAPPTAP
jgi:DNA ligase 1